MDEKIKNFIASVPSILSVHEMQIFKKAIKALEDPEATLNEKDNAFSEIKEHMENKEFTTHFTEVGGTDIIVPFLSHSNIKLKKHAMDCVTAMVDNNKECKNYLIQANIMPFIVDNFKSTEYEVIETALQTASSLVPHNDYDSLKRFIDAEGIKALLQIFYTGHRRLSYQACSLIATLSEESDFLRDQIIIKLDPNQIIYHFESTEGFDSNMEILLSALSALTKSDQWNPGDFVNEKIIEIVQEISDLCSAMPEMDRTLELTKNILQRILLH